MLIDLYLHPIHLKRSHVLKPSYVPLAHWAKNHEYRDSSGTLSLSGAILTHELQEFQIKAYGSKY